jgi:hypothetical protein
MEMDIGIRQTEGCEKTFVLKGALGQIEALAAATAIRKLLS